MQLLGSQNDMATIRLLSSDRTFRACRLRLAGVDIWCAGYLLCLADPDRLFDHRHHFISHLIRKISFAFHIPAASLLKLFSILPRTICNHFSHTPDNLLKPFPTPCENYFLLYKSPRLKSPGMEPVWNKRQSNPSAKDRVNNNTDRKSGWWAAMPVSDVFSWIISHTVCFLVVWDYIMAVHH